MLKEGERNFPLASCCVCCNSTVTTLVFFAALNGQPEQDDYAIFIQDRRVAHIMEGELILASADGTYFVCPAVFAQLYTLMVLYKGIMIPALHILMTSKNKELYQGVFKKIKLMYPNFDPQFFTTDFEAAPAIAIKKYFPDTNLKGCILHFNKACYKKFGQLGLIPWLKKETRIRILLKRIMCLPFLPPSKIATQIHFIRNDSKKIADPVAKYLFQKFIDEYIVNFWYKKIGPSRLGMFGITRRTNNDLESLHATMKRDIKLHQPTFYRFLHLLKKFVLADAVHKTTQVDQGLEVGFADRKGNALLKE